MSLVELGLLWNPCTDRWMRTWELPEQKGTRLWKLVRKSGELAYHFWTESMSIGPQEACHSTSLITIDSTIQWGIAVPCSSKWSTIQLWSCPVGWIFKIPRPLYPYQLVHICWSAVPGRVEQHRGLTQGEHLLIVFLRLLGTWGHLVLIILNVCLLPQLLACRAWEYTWNRSQPKQCYFTCFHPVYNTWTPGKVPGPCASLPATPLPPQPSPSLGIPPGSRSRD